MGLEVATYISDLNASNPVGASDRAIFMDDHIRLLKNTLQATFPNVAGAVGSSHTELNIIDGVTASAAELNKLDGATATATEINYLSGATSAIQTQLDAKRESLSGGGGRFAGRVVTTTSANVDINTWIIARGSCTSLVFQTSIVSPSDKIRATNAGSSSVSMTRFGGASWLLDGVLKASAALGAGYTTELIYVDETTGWVTFNTRYEPLP